MDGSSIADAVLDIELDKGRHFAPAERIPFERLSTLRRVRETMLSQAQQRAIRALLEIEFDRGHHVGRFAPPKDEALGGKDLDHVAFAIGIDVPFGSPTAPAEGELSTRPEVNFTAARPPPRIHRLRGRQCRPYLRARRADEHAMTDLGDWFAHSCSSTKCLSLTRRCSQRAESVVSQSLAASSGAVS